MSDFLKRLSRDPYTPIDGASVTRIDELGNGYDDWNNLIAPNVQQPEQTWGETALGVATAPARIATALAGSLSPYGPNGWQVPPIINEGGDALTAVGDAYSGKMAPEEIPGRALGMAGFMMGGGGPALALERSLPQASVSLGDRVMAKYLDWKHPDARSTRNVLQNNADYLNELKRRPKGVDGSYDSDTLERIRMWEGKVYGQPLTPYRSRFQDAIQQMNKTLHDDIDRMKAGGETALNDFIDDLPRLTPDDTGYMNALLQTRKPEFDVIYGATKAFDDARYNDLVRRSFERFGKHYESLNPEQTRVIRDGVTNRASFDVIDGGLFSNSDSRPGVMAGATAGQETEDGYADGGRVGFNPKYLVLHDYGGNPANLDGVFNPYHVLVFPDGSKRYRYPDDPYGRKAPHAFRLNPESVGISYAGDVGSQPTAAAMETLRNEAKAVADMFPGIEAMGHGEAFQATRGTNRQASRDGRDIEEASWRSNILYGPPAPGQTQVASAPVPMSKRGLTSFAGLEPSTAPVVRALPSPARSLAAAEMDAEPIATAEDKPSSFDLTKLASLFAEPEQAQAHQVQFTPIQAFQPQGSPIQASTPYRGTFAHGGQVRGLPDQSEPIHAGPLHSTVPGRTDHLPITVAAGSFVLPADIVSSLGEGNTNAGMEAVSEMFPPPPVRRADGGRVPIAAAGGEYVIAPETVAALGNGDMETGHELLDQFVRRTRAQNIQRLRALPGPEK